MGRLSGAGQQSEGRSPRVGGQGWGRFRRDERRGVRLPDDEEGGKSCLFGADCSEGGLGEAGGGGETLSVERGEGWWSEGWRHEERSPGGEEHEERQSPGGEVKILGCEVLGCRRVTEEGSA